MYSVCIPALLADREEGRGAGNNIYVSTDILFSKRVQDPAKKGLD